MDIRPILMLFRQTNKTIKRQLEEMELPLNTFFDWENGKSYPTNEDLIKLSKYYNKNIDELKIYTEIPSITISKYPLEDYSYFFVEKLHLALSHLSKIIDFLLINKKLCDINIEYIHNILEDTIIYLTHLLAETSGNAFHDIEAETILKKGYKGYTEICKKYRITNERINELQKRRFVAKNSLTNIIIANDISGNNNYTNSNNVINSNDSLLMDNSKKSEDSNSEK